ncbi:MAG TPA: hypothetical protein HA362_00445 [Nanoarchaeota archaeon]|nr:hypothetical protein [Nanoarchaeota archaeon]
MIKVKSKRGVLAEYLRNPYIETSLMAVIYFEFSSIVLDYFPKKKYILLCWSIISAIVIIGYWAYRQKAYSNKT